MSFHYRHPKRLPALHLRLLLLITSMDCAAQPTVPTLPWVKQHSQDDGCVPTPYTCTTLLTAILCLLLLSPVFLKLQFCGFTVRLVLVFLLMTPLLAQFCIHTHIHVDIDVYMDTYRNIYTYIGIYAHICIYHTCMHKHTCMIYLMHVHTYTYVHIHICTYICMYIHTHMYTPHSVPMHTHTHRHFFISLYTKLLQFQRKLVTFRSFTSLLKISTLWWTSLFSEVTWFYYSQLGSVYIPVHRSSFFVFFISIKNIAFNETPKAVNCHLLPSYSLPATCQDLPSSIF